MLKPMQRQQRTGQSVKSGNQGVKVILQAMVWEVRRTEAEEEEGNRKEN
jgi:hypothetical protein